MNGVMDTATTNDIAHPPTGGYAFCRKGCLQERELFTKKAGEQTGSPASILRPFLLLCSGGRLGTLDVHLAGSIAFAAAAMAAERPFLDFGTSKQGLVHSAQDIGYVFHD